MGRVGLVNVTKKGGKKEEEKKRKGVSHLANIILERRLI
jgi:hypothetical protein